MVKTLCLLLMLLVVVVGSASAQTAALPVAPQIVQVEAADGLKLIGDYYYGLQKDAGEAMPAVLLMHMLGSSREAWSPLIPALLDAGYNVLNVDLRGHGATGGAMDWPAATSDVQTWLDWLRAQPDVRSDGIAIIGASIGSNLALIGCAADPACATAVALSPGLDYQGLKPEDAVIDGLQARSALLIASQDDTYSADSIRQMVTDARGDIGLRLYTGSLHGTNLFGAKLDSVTGLIVGWLDEHTRAKGT